MEWLGCGVLACLSLYLLIKLHLWWAGRDARKYGAPFMRGTANGRPRSSRWPRVRDQCIERDGGRCQICDEKRRRYLRGHHKKPFHKFPELELDPDNVITLCEGPVFNCHLLFGHWGDYRERWNPNIDEDVKTWQPRLGGS